MTRTLPATIRTISGQHDRRQGLMAGAGLHALLTSAAVAAAATPALAQVTLPTGNTNATNVSVASTATTMTLAQTGKRAYVEWSNFSIGQGGTVNVTQGARDWILVNRVTGGFQSFISGNLNATGNVWILNSNGITVTPTGRIDVGGLMLSASPVIRGFGDTGGYTTDAAGFFQGDPATSNSTAWRFSGGGQDIFLESGSEILARGGVVAFMSPSTYLEGTISHPSGSGRTEVLGLAARTADISFGVDASANFNLNDVTIISGLGRVENPALSASGSITASRIVLAAGASNIGNLAGLLTVSGTLTADSARASGGDIVLFAAARNQTSSTAPSVARNVLIGGNAGTNAGFQLPVLSNETADIIATNATFNLAPNADLFAIAARDGRIEIGNVNTSGDGGINLNAGRVVAGFLNAAGTGNVRIDAGSVLSAGINGNQINVLADNGQARFTGSVTAKGDATITASGSISLGSGLVVGAGSNVTLDAGSTVGDGSLTVTATNGSVTAGDITASGQLDISAATGVSVFELTTFAGDINVDGGTGEVRLTSVNTPGNLSIAGGTLTQTSGQLFDTSNLLFSGDLTLNARAGDLQVGSFDQSLNGSISLSASGNLTAGNLITYNGDVSLRGGSISARDLQGVDVSASASSGNINLYSAVARDDVVLIAPTGQVNVSFGDVLSGAILNYNVDGGTLVYNPIERIGAADQLAGAVLNGNDVVIRGTGGFVGGDLIAGVDTTSSASNLSVDFGTGVLRLGFFTSVEAKGDLTIKSSKITSLGGISIGSVDGSLDLTSDLESGLGNITLTASNGTVRVGKVSAGVIDPGPIGAPGAEAGSPASNGLNYDINITGNGITVADTLARNITLNGVNGTVRIGGSMDAGQAINVTTSGSVSVATGVFIDAGTSVFMSGSAVAADQDLNIVADGGDVTVVGPASAQRDVLINASGAIQTDSLTATRDIDLFGRSVSVGAMSGRDVLATARSSLVRLRGPINASGQVGLYAFNQVSFSTGAFIQAATGVTISSYTPPPIFSSVPPPQPPLTVVADQSLLINSTSGPITIAGSTTANQNITITGGGDLAAGSLTAQNGALQVTMGGGIQIFGNASASGLLSLSAATGISTQALRSFNLDVIVDGGTSAVSVGAVTAARDVSLSGGSLVTSSFSGGRDILLNARTSALNVGSIFAQRDLSLSGTSVTASGTILANRDIAVQATAGNVSLTGGAEASDDVAIRATGSISAGSAIVSGRSTAVDGVGVADTLAGTTLAGNDIDITGAGFTLGSLTANGPASDVRVDGGTIASSAGFITAGQDIALAAGTLATTGLNGGRDIALTARTGALSVSSIGTVRDLSLTGQSVIATGNLSAGRDIAVQATSGNISMVGAFAGDDVVLRATGSISASSGIIAGLSPSLDAVGVGDALAGISLGGNDIDIRGLGITLGSLTANGPTSDVLVDGGTGATSVGAVNAGQDITLAGGTLSTTSLTGGRDVSLTARTGALNLTGASAVRDLSLTGVSVSSTSGVNSGRDIAVQATGGNIALTTVRAGDDVAMRSTGSVSATQILSGQSTGLDANGVADALLGVTALGNDIIITSQGANIGQMQAPGTESDISVDAGTGAATFNFSTAGRDIALSGGTVGSGFLTAGRDVSMLARSGALTITGTNAGRDVSLTGQSVAATGILQAGRDIAVQATAGDIVLLGAEARDDIAMRATGSVTVSSGLIAGIATSLDEFGVADTLAGATLAGNDIDIQSAGASLSTLTANGAGSDVRVDGGTVATSVGAVNAGQDIILAGGTLGTNALNGGRDISLTARTGALSLGSASAVRDLSLTGVSVGAKSLLSGGRDVAIQATGGDISIADASAGDDLVLRATGAISASSSLLSGQVSGSDAAGVGDTLAGATLAGNDIDSVSAGGTFSVLGASGTGSDVRINGGAVITSVSTVNAGQDIVISGGAVTTSSLDAGRDILLNASNGLSVGSAIAARDLSMVGTSVTSSGLLNGRDVLIRATSGNISIAGTSARDDVVLRATGSVASTGPIVSGASNRGGGAVDEAGVADAFLGSTITGSDINIASAGATLGSLTANQDAANAGSDVVVDGGTGAVSVLAVTAGRDITLAGGSLATTTFVGGRDISLTARTSTLAIGPISAVRDLSLTGQSVSGSGALSAGRDIAVQATTGSISLVGATAGDDIALRAVTTIAATGGLVSGQAPSIDQAGVADTLAGTALAGNDIDIVGAGATLANLTATGTGSDVRVDGGTVATTVGAVTAGQDISVSGGTVGTGALTGNRDITLLARAGGLTVANAAAVRDLSLTGRSVTATGALSGGRDIAVSATAGNVSLIGASAGDDLVIRATGSVSASSGLLSGQVSGSDGAGAGDTLAAIALAGNDIDIIGAGGSLGPLTATGTFSDVRVDGGTAGVSVGSVIAGQDAVLTGGTLNAGAVTAARDALLTASSGSLSLNGVSVGRDLSATGVTVTASGLLTARDVAIRATGGAISLAGVSARDDVALRATGAISSSGAIVSGISPSEDAAGVADTLAGTALAGNDIDIVGAGATLANLTATGTGSDVRVDGGTVATTVGAVTAGQDISVSGGTVGTGALTGNRDITLLARAGGLTVANAAAVRDLSLTGRSVTATGALSGGRDIAVSATAGNVSLIGASAGDDLVIRATGSVSASSGLLSGQVSGSDGAGAGDTLAAIALAGNDIDIIGAGATLNNLTATGAGSDVRVDGGTAASTVGILTAAQDISVSGGTVGTGALNGGRDITLLARAGTVTVANAAAQRDLSLTGVNVSATGALSGRDVAVQATAGTIAVATITARDDVALRATGGITATGLIQSGQGAAVDEAGVADALAGTTLAGNDIDIIGLGGTFGPLTATGVGSDVRVDGGTVATTLGAVTAGQDINLAGGTLGIGTLTGGRDIFLNARTGALTLGAAAAVRDLSVVGQSVTANGLLSGRDVAVQARAGAISLAGVTARDDVVLRATGAISSSATIGSGQGTAVDEAGVADVLAGTTLGGNDLDATGVGGTLTAITATGAASDVRFDAGTGTLATGAVTAGQDINLAAGTLSVSSATAARDVVLLARSGALAITNVSAGRDLSATGLSVTSTGLLTGRDIAISATAGTIAVAGINARDDVALRATGAITASGPIVSGQSPSEDAVGVADALAGGTLAGNDIDIVGAGATLNNLTATGTFSDVRVDGGTAGVSVGSVIAGQDAVLTGGTLNTGAVTAARDALLTASSGSLSLNSVSVGRDLSATGVTVTASGLLTARDVAIRATGGAISLAGVSARDDVALRATGAISSSGAIVSGISPSEDAAGVADTLAGTALAGNDIDIVGAGATLANLTATGTGSDVRVDGGTVATTVGAVTAGQDISVSGGTVGTGALNGGRDIALLARGGALTVANAVAVRDLSLTGVSVAATGALSGRDVAVQATGGTISVAAISARDDVAMRATGAITATGNILSGVGPASDEVGVADALAGTTLAGNDIDIVGLGATLALVGTLIGNPGSDVRIDGGTGATSMGDVSANQDVILAGGTLSSGPLVAGRDALLTARSGNLAVNAVVVGRDLSATGVSVTASGLLTGRDIAIRATGGAISLAGINARDDVALRATGAITSSLQIGSGQGAATDELGVADVLAGTTLVGSDVDIVSAGGSLAALQAIGAASDVRVNAGSAAMTVATVVAGQDVTLSAGTLGASERISAGRDIALTATNGGLSVTGATAARDLSLTGFTIAASALLSARDVAIRATAGGISLTGVTARDDVALRATGTITATGNIASGQGAAVDEAGVADTLAGSALAGNDIDSVGSGGTLVQLTAAGAASDVRLDGGTGSTSLGAVAAGQDIVLASGSLVTSGLVSGRDISLTARTSTLTVGNLVATRDLSLTGTSVVGGALGGTDVAVQATGPTGTVALTSVTARDDIAIRAPGAITVAGTVFSGAAVGGPAVDSVGLADALAGAGTLTGNDVDIRGGSVTIGGAVRSAGAGSDVRVAATAGDARLNGLVDAAATATLSATGALGFGTGATVRAGGNAALSGASIAAVQDLIVTSDTGSVSVAGPASAVRNIGLTAATAVSSGGLNAGGTVTLDGATQSATGALSGSSVAIRARNGGISVGAVTSTAGTISLDASGTVLASGIVQSASGQRVDIFANDLDLGSAGSLRAPNGSVRLYARRAVKIGGTDDPTRFSVSGAEAGRIESGELLVFGGQPTATGGAPAGAAFDIELADLTFTSALQTLRLYTGPTGLIAVTGTVSRGTATGASLTLGHAATDAGRSAAGTGWTPAKVRISGTIGANSSPFRLVSINASDIIMAPLVDSSLPNGFEPAVAGATNNQPQTLPLSTDPSVQNKVFVTANELQLRSSGQILQRNTDTVANRGRGIQVGRLIIDSLTSGGAGPTRISLFGIIDRSNAAVAPTLTSTGSQTAVGEGDYSPAEGVAAALAIRTFGPATPNGALRFGFNSEQQFSYRINGCVMITGAGCGQSPVLPDGPTQSLLESLKTFTLEALIINPFKPLDETEDEFAPVDEEPVTNSGGELEWPVQRRTAGPAVTGTKGGAAQ